jgi:hypothetical protein
MVEFTVPLLLDIIRTAGILVGIVYYITIMRNQQRAQREAEKSRRNELVYGKLQNISLEYATSFNEVMTLRDWRDPEEWEEKYGRNNNLEAFSKWNYIIRHYTLAGLLLKQGADPEIIFELYPYGAVINLYEMWREKNPDSEINN